MNTLLIVSVILGIIAVSTAVGLLLQANTGRVRRSRVVGRTPLERVAVDSLDTDAIAGERATILQFSTELCASCKRARVLLGGVAGERSGVTHVDVDVTSRPDIADRFSLLQSPTTLLLDSRGVVRARIGGLPSAASIRAELDHMLLDQTALDQSVEAA